MNSGVKNTGQDRKKDESAWKVKLQTMRFFMYTLFRFQFIPRCLTRLSVLYSAYICNTQGQIVPFSWDVIEGMSQAMCL